jgi:hypothetical protein
MPIQPFSPPFSQAAVDDLRDRLARTRWIDEIPGSGWQYGFNLDFLKDLCRYWREEFDWNAQVERVSSCLIQLRCFEIVRRSRKPPRTCCVRNFRWPQRCLKPLHELSGCVANLRVRMLPLSSTPGEHTAV